MSVPNIAFEEALDTYDQQMFVQSLLSHGVSDLVIAAALPTQAVAALSGVSTESYRNELNGATSIQSIVEYDSLSPVAESYAFLAGDCANDAVSIEALTVSAGALKDRVADAIDKLKDKLVRLKAWSDEQAKKGADYAKEHPYKTAGGILATIAVATAALLLCKFLMKRSSDIKSAYADLNAAKSEFESSFAKNAENLAKQGKTPGGVGMGLGTKGSTATTFTDTVRYHADGSSTNISEINRNLNTLWDRVKSTESELEKLISSGKGSSEDAQKLRSTYNSLMGEIIKNNTASSARPGDTVGKVFTDVAGSRVTWDYTTLSDKISEATASLDKLKNAFGSAKEFMSSLGKGLSPTGTGATSTFNPGKLIVVWKLSVYGAVSVLVAGLLNKASGHVPEKQ